MVHKFKNKVENFLFSEMPVDSMDYERKGGCFVTITKGVILTILFVVFGFILGLIVFYTTKHAYQNTPPISLDEFIGNVNEKNDYATIDTITPKHYRLIVNPMLNDTQDRFSFNGNVWITITANDDNTRTIELDVHDLDIRAEDVSVYRSRILSDLNFQLDNDRGKRSAQLTEDDDDDEPIETDETDQADQSDMLINSTERIDENVTTDAENESQDVVEGIEENDTVTTTDVNEAENVEATDIIEAQSVEGTDMFEDTTELPAVTESIDYDDANTTWDGLMQNDSMLKEPNPNDQTELQIDGVVLNTERKKLIITLNSALRRGHYYIVKVFFSGNMTNDYGLVYKSYDDTGDSNDNFIAAAITDPMHTPALFPCFNNFSGEVTFDLNLIRHDDHQSVSVSKLMGSQKITNNWTLDTYRRTSPMKLEHFGFVITNVEAIIVTVTPHLMLNSYFRPKLLPSITFIDSEIPSLLKKIALYTNVTYPMEAINFIGLPSSSNDVIEIKEGLVIASESLFMAHDETDKQIKAQIISQIIGKLWYQPWEIVQFKNQEWINEALPLQLKLMSDGSDSNNYFNSETMIEKRMESMRKEQSFIEFTLNAFSDRHLDTNWIDVAQCKGLYLLAVLENVLTEPVYQSGIQRFFKSDGPTNFIETFGNLTKDLKIDQTKSMEKSIQEWSHQIGFPIIQIQKNANYVQIQQMEFGRSTSHFWSTPITIKNQTFWLQKNSMNFDIEDNDWLTVKSNGYFRVNYDETHWDTILKALRMDHKLLSAMDRAVLMDDALNLAQYNYLNYSIVENLLECWNEQETEYLPWKAALVNLEFVYRNTDDLSFDNSFNILLRNLTQRVYHKIVRSPLREFSYKLQILIKKWSCQIYALPDCLADAKKDFQNLIVNNTLKRSQRSSSDVKQLYCTSIRFGGDIQNWYLIRNSIDQNDNHNYNEALIYALGCSTDHRLLSEYFQLLFKENYKDYAEAMFQSMKDNRIGHKYALEYLYANFEELRKIHGLHTFKALLKGISTPYDYKLFQLFFSNNSSLFNSDDKKTLAEIVNSIKSNLNWKHNFAEVFNTS